MSSVTLSINSTSYTTPNGSTRQLALPNYSIANPLDISQQISMTTDTSDLVTVPSGATYAVITPVAGNANTWVLSGCNATQLITALTLSSGQQSILNNAGSVVSNLTTALSLTTPQQTALATLVAQSLPMSLTYASLLAASAITGSQFLISNTGAGTLQLEIAYI